MIADIRACVPESLSTFGRRIAFSRERTDGVRRVRSAVDLETILGVFGKPFGPRADQRAMVSLWTQYYFAALVVASVTATLCLDRELPLALGDTGIAFDEQGRPTWLLLASTGRRSCEGCPRFTVLIDAHLRPLIALCAGQTGVPPRVLWGNAGVIFDLTVREVARTRPVVAAANAEAETLLGRREAPGRAETPLRHTLVAGASDGAVRRSVCCLRFRLPGVADCGALCPMIRRGAAC